MNDIFVPVEGSFNLCLPAGDLISQINLLRRGTRSRGMTLLVYNHGVRPPEFRFEFLSSFLPFCPFFLGFSKDPRNVLLRIFALDPGGGLFKSGTRASHVYQTVDLRP